MANLGIFEIDTDNEYVKLDTITGLTFSVDTKYTMQVQNVGAYLTVCVSDTTPTEGGFIMGYFEKFYYTPVSGEDIYVKTGNCGKVYLNIAE